MGKLTLFVNESANDPSAALVESRKSRAPAKPIVFTQGDTARPIEIHFLEESKDASGDPFVNATAPSSTRLGVGSLDLPPTGGTFIITDPTVAESTSALAYNVTAADMQTAMRAALTTNYSTCTVTGSYTAGYVIDRVAVGAIVDISTDADTMSPENCVAELVNTDQGTSERSETWSLKFVQPMALKQTSFTAVTYAAPAVASVTTGSAGVNAVHRITWPSAAYAGSISISQAIPTSATAKAITSNTAANPSVFTAATHGLTSGDRIYIPANNGSTPTVAGVHVVTVSDANTFTIPVNVSGGGTGGEFYPVSLQTIGPIPYNVGVSALEDLFEEHTSTLAVDGNFTAEKVSPGNYLMSYKGTLAGIPIPTGTVTSSLSTPIAVEGTLNCSTAGMLNLLAGSQEATAKLEIEKTVSAVPTTVAYLPSVTLRAELLTT